MKKKFIPWDAADIGEEEVEAVTEATKSGYIGSNGPLVRQFEKEFARKMDTKYAIGVNNGTSALLCALQAFRHKMGDLRVGVATFTFIASANTANEVGKEVKLIDCCKETWNINRETVPSGINLLMPVDVGGLPVDYDSLKELEIPILADSAEATGAKYKGKNVGSQANVHAFSFHRAKIITTGEGGMITTNDEEFYELMRAIANHGYSSKREKWEYKHSIRAFNYRMIELQATVGLVQLKKLDEYVRKRREKAKIYKDILQDLVGYQAEPENCYHSYFFFGILVEKNVSSFCEEMYRNKIEVKTWTPVHKQEPYRYMNVKLMNAEWLGKRIVLLPIHNKLTEEETKYVAETVRGILKR